MYLRRVLCLHRGDLQSAERFRRKAEVLAVQANMRQMFATASVGRAQHRGDDARPDRGQTARRQITPLAASTRAGGRSVSWPSCTSTGCAEISARRALPRTRAGAGRAATASSGKRVHGVVPITTPYIEVLTEMGATKRPGIGRAHACDVCRARRGQLRRLDNRRAVAIAQAKLGDLEGAAARLDASIATQTGVRWAWPDPRRKLRGARTRGDLVRRPRRGRALRPARGARISARPHDAARRALRTLDPGGARGRHGRVAAARSRFTVHVRRARPRSAACAPRSNTR